MVTVKRRHCAGRKTMIVHSNGMISQKNTSNIISEPDKWLQSWEMSKKIKTTKKEQSTTVMVKQFRCAGRKKTYNGSMTRSNNED